MALKEEAKGRRSLKQNSELKSLANALLPMIRTIYESEEGHREFAAWQKEIQDEKPKD